MLNNYTLDEIRQRCQRYNKRAKPTQRGLIVYTFELIKNSNAIDFNKYEHNYKLAVLIVDIISGTTSATTED